MKCAVKNCRNEDTIGYYDKPVCEKHWQWHCDDSKKFNLKEVLKVREPKVKKEKHFVPQGPAKKGKKCPSCKEILKEVPEGVKCSRCTYALYMCSCGRKFKKKFALTNHKKYCKTKP